MEDNLGKLLAVLTFFIALIGVTSAVKWDNAAYWNLDQISDPIKDVTGNGYDGTIVGKPIPGVDGRISKAIDFNYARGEDNYVNTSDIDLSGSVSYSLWVIPRETGDDTTYLSKRDEKGGTTIEVYANKNFNFCIRTTSKDSKKGWTPLKQFFNTLSRIFLGKDLKNYTFWGLTALEENCASSIAPLSSTEWHFIVAVYDETKKNMFLYIDGKYVTSAVHQTGLPLNNKNYVIGANAMGKEGFDGGKGGSEGAADKIDEIGIWNRALNSTEILELYNSGKGVKYAEQIS